VHIFLDNFGTAKHIVLAGRYVHDVNGANDKKDNGGIALASAIPSLKTELSIYEPRNGSCQPVPGLNCGCPSILPLRKR
jgi:hypothetical protein